MREGGERWGGGGDGGREGGDTYLSIINFSIRANEFDL